MEDKAGSIVELPGVAYYDTRTKQSFKKVRKLKGKSALPYRDGEIPVKATKMGQLESDGYDEEGVDDRKDGGDDEKDGGDDGEEVVMMMERRWHKSCQYGIGRIESLGGNAWRL